MKIKIFVIAIAIFLGGTHLCQAQTYAVDRSHSSVTFKIRHLFSNVQGTFNEFDGVIQYDPKNPTQWSVSATVQAASIDTANENRDKHLKSDDFFNVESYPELTFKSESANVLGDGIAKLSGILSMHGVSKPVVFDLEIHGVGEDPWGNVRAGFTAETTISRKDFNLNWNETLETGQLLVGDEVKIILEIEGIVK